MEMRLEQKDADDWIYRGEGAVNLVLAYAGSSSFFMGKVMRIVKVPTGEDGNGNTGFVESLTIHEKLIWREIEELNCCQSQEALEHNYVKYVMGPLLGTNHVDPGIRVLVSKEFLENIGKNVSYQRPYWRIDAAKIDTNRDSVLVMNDFTSFSSGVCPVGTCLSVEIKQPKCGFLPFSGFICEGNDVKKLKTRFAMHQVLKLQENEISELSDYCPLDLFSHSKGRILKAIRALYATPQNNFRVFLNGSLVFGSSGGSTGGTTAMKQAFENVLKGVIQADDDLCLDSFMELVAETLESSGVLDQLLKVQQLDNYDIEGVIHAYYDVISQPCMACNDCESLRESARCNFLHSIPLDESLKIVKDYLISATAKDCSLMFSFRSAEAGNLNASDSSVYLESTNQLFNYEVHFIDLDLKSLKKIEDYYELDKKIINCYLQKPNHRHRQDIGIIMNGCEGS